MGVGLPLLAVDYTAVWSIGLVHKARAGRGFFCGLLLLREEEYVSEARMEELVGHHVYSAIISRHAPRHIGRGTELDLRQKADLLDHALARQESREESETLGFLRPLGFRHRLREL